MPLRGMVGKQDCLPGRGRELCILRKRGHHPFPHVPRKTNCRRIPIRHAPLFFAAYRRYIGGAGGEGIQKSSPWDLEPIFGRGREGRDSSFQSAGLLACCEHIHTNTVGEIRGGKQGCQTWRTICSPPPLLPYRSLKLGGWVAESLTVRAVLPSVAGLALAPAQKAGAPAAAGVRAPCPSRGRCRT